MKFTLSWLKEHLTTDETLDALADKLTMIGLEVEHLDDKAKALKDFSRNGPIGLQGLHGKAQAPVWYRNIRIKELK